LVIIPVALLFVAAATTIHNNNWRTVADTDAGYKPPRSTFEQAVHRGIFERFVVGSPVISEWSAWYTWIDEPMIRYLGGPRLHVYQGLDANLAAPCGSTERPAGQAALDPRKPVWIFGTRIDYVYGRDGAAILGSVRSLSRTGGGGATVLIDRLRVYEWQLR
jgi:hypothetical protein